MVCHIENKLKSGDAVQMQILMQKMFFFHVHMVYFNFGEQLF